MKKFILSFLICFTVSGFSQKTTADLKSIRSSSSISFTENKGQVSDQNYKPRPDVLFSGTDGKLNFHLKSNGISYQLNRVDSWKEEEDPKTKQKIRSVDQSTIYRLDINWLNANKNPTIKKGNVLEGYNNYYLASCPNGALNVKSHEEITYQQIYKGVDLKWYQKDGHLKYDYIVAAGADYKQIRLEVKGTERIILNNKGELILQTPLGIIIEQAPLVIQNGKELKSEWQIKNNIINFHVEKLNPEQDFIIDPAVRIWGTYYGDVNNDFISCTISDFSNNIYAGGSTTGSTGLTIATGGSHQTTMSGPYEAFLVKFNSNGSRVWGTYYGGTGSESASACATDLFGNVYLAGATDSNNGSSIATLGSHQSTFGGDQDAFIVKFNSSGVRQWGTYYGGLLYESLSSCITDATGNIYVTGITVGSAGTSIATIGSHQASYGGGSADGFLVKLNNNGVRQWGTYYGGAVDDYAYSVSTDATGNIFVAGYTTTGSGTSIATPGSFQSIYNGGIDAYLVKFDLNGVRQWGTYYGGFLQDRFVSCTSDASGNIYSTGFTTSNAGTVIATTGCYQNTLAGGGDALLVKFNTNGSRQWGTYFGGPGNDAANSCTTDNQGNIYFTGVTNSGTAIATSPNHQTTFAGGSNDGFLAKFNNNGLRLWSTYYGGASDDGLNSCACDGLNNVFIAGSTSTSGGSAIANFGFQNSLAGSYDGFLVKLCSGPEAPNNTSLPANQNICNNTTTTLSASGTATLSWYSAATGGSFLGGGGNYVTPNLSLTSVYYVQDSSSCSASIRTPVTVSVGPVILVNSGSICYGQTFSINPNGANTYTFSSGSAIVTPSVSTNYTITGTSLSGCQGVAISSVIVNPTPTITMNNGSICIGDSYTLIPAGALSYTFINGGPIVTPTSTSVYTITGTDVFGCNGSAIANITVNSIPIINVNSGAICTGSSFTINPTGANTYTISGGFAVVSPTITTNYSVTGTSSAGCLSNTISIASLTVNATPTVIALSNTSLICEGQSATLTANGANTYTWSSGGNGPGISISPTVTTSYSVTGTDANGCQNVATITQSVSLCTGAIHSPLEKVEDGVLIYPNPNNGNFIVEFNSPSQIIIYNALGQTIYNEKQSDLKSQIEISNYSNGIYLIQILNEEKIIYSGRIIKN